MSDIDKAMDTLSEMLSSEEGKQTLSDMVSSFAGDTNDNSLSQSSPSDFFNMETILRLKGAMDEIQNSNDRRSNLLYALKPYLNSSRLSRIDETINLLKLTKLPLVIKGIRK